MMGINIQAGRRKGDDFLLTPEGDLAGARGLFGEIVVQIDLLVLGSDQLVVPQLADDLGLVK